MITIRLDTEAAPIIDYGFVKSIGEVSYKDPESEKTIPTISIEIYIDRVVPNLNVLKKKCRLEKYDFGGPPKNQFENLFFVMEDSIEALRVRDIFINQTPPVTMKEKASQDHLSQTIRSFKHHVAGCDKDVKVSVLKILMTSKMGIELTGEDEEGILRQEFVTVITKCLEAAGKSVLIICSDSDLLGKILESLSPRSHSTLSHTLSEDKTPSALKEFQFDYRITKMATTEQISLYMDNIKLFATNSTSRHPILRKRTFDYAFIIDSDALKPLVLFRHLSRCEKFIAVGKNHSAGNSANSGGSSRRFDESMFAQVRDNWKGYGCWKEISKVR